jgi:hypothetical protein
VITYLRKMNLQGRNIYFGYSFCVWLVGSLEFGFVVWQDIMERNVSGIAVHIMEARKQREKKGPTSHNHLPGHTLDDLTSSH